MFWLKFESWEVFLTLISLLNYCHYIRTLSISCLMITWKILADRSLNIFYWVYFFGKKLTLQLNILFLFHNLVVLVLSITPLNVSRLSDHKTWFTRSHFIWSAWVKRLFWNPWHMGHAFELCLIYWTFRSWPSSLNCSRLFLIINHREVQRLNLLQNRLEFPRSWSFYICVACRKWLKVLLISCPSLIVISVVFVS